MTTELKQAAQQAVDAFDAFGDADDFASLFELTQKMRALRTAIQQAEAQQPATTDLRIGVCITDGVLHAAVMQHESNGVITVVATAEIDAASLHGRDCIGRMKPATGEPVYWEWRHLSTHPNTVDFGQWSEWQRVEARNAIHTIEGALAEFRTYIAQGYKYELRALYTPSNA